MILYPKHIPMKRRQTVSKPAVDPAMVLLPEYRRDVVDAAYVGRKGYTIPKSVLSKSDETFLKKDLLVRPVMKGVQYGVSDAAFPVYRENANKIYLPRFYGISRYGLPTRSELDPGTAIAVTFDKPLRDYQEKIVGVYTDYVGGGGGGAILEVPCGR